MSASGEIASNIITPHAATLLHASNIAIEQDRPIMLDYYGPSTRREARLVKTQDRDTILYKNNEEYTSPLKKVFQIDGSQTDKGKDIICLSENSIYIVHSTILQKA
jgi:hypothetical protein